MAIASSYIEGGGVSDWTLSRRVVSRCAQFLGLVVLPEITGKVSDPMSGFFLVRRSALEGRDSTRSGYKILVEVLARGDIEKISEVPYVFRERPESPQQAFRLRYSCQYLEAPLPPPHSPAKNFALRPLLHRRR